MKVTLPLGCLVVCTLLVSAAPPSKQPVDSILEQAQPRGGLWFPEQVTSKIEPGRDLIITSARDADGKPQTVRVRMGTMQVFRADATRDEFTKDGGWYWRSGEAEGKLRFKKNIDWGKPAGDGPLVMVVYQTDGTIHWYSLVYDLRC